MCGREEEEHDDDSDNDSVRVFCSWAVPTRPTDFLDCLLEGSSLALRNFNFATNWRVRAHPLSAADDVAETVREHFGLSSPPMVQPRGALWWEVTRFRLPPPYPSRTRLPGFARRGLGSKTALEDCSYLGRDLMTVRRTVVFGSRAEPDAIVERLQSLPDIRQQLRLEVTPGNVWVAIVDQPRVFPLVVLHEAEGRREARKGGERGEGSTRNTV